MPRRNNNSDFMISSLLSLLASIIISVISTAGYFGVFFLMALESACVPIPSEIIMPFAGFLIWQGEFTFFSAVVWGALGNLAGSILAYYAGYYGGRAVIEKYGKYILISHHDLSMSDKWFAKYGQGAVFFGRLLPVIRTFISLPAGIARMDIKRFCIFTFLGSLFWSGFLAYIGCIMGENWENIKFYFHKFDILIGVLLIVGAVWWVRRHLKNSNASNNVE